MVQVLREQEKQKFATCLVYQLGRIYTALKSKVIDDDRVYAFFVPIDPYL